MILYIISNIFLLTGFGYFTGTFGFSRKKVKNFFHLFSETKLRRSCSSLILNLNLYRYLRMSVNFRLGLIFINVNNLTKVIQKHSQYRHLLCWIIRDISFQRHLRRCPLFFTTFPKVSDDDTPTLMPHIGGYISLIQPGGKEGEGTSYCSLQTPKKRL